MDDDHHGLVVAWIFIGEQRNLVRRSTLPLGQ
jgi:hypothetical protein